MTARARRIGRALATAPPEALWRHVTEGAPVADLRPDAVQFALLREALIATGRRIAVQFTETGATLNLTEVSPAPA